MAEAKPSWIKTKPEELEKIITELAKAGNSPSKIGLILRDKHGIPKSKLLSKKITQILEEKKVPYKKEISHVEEQIEKIKQHFNKNKHDYTAQRALTKKLWALHRIKKQTA